MVDSASGPYQAPGARHIVSQGVPQGGCLDLFQAAHEELLQSSIAGLGVPLFAPAPCRWLWPGRRPCGCAKRRWQVRRRDAEHGGRGRDCAVRAPAHRRRRRRGLDRRCRPVWQSRHRRGAAPVAGHSRRLVHRCHLAHVGADGVDRDPGNRPTSGIAGELHVVGGPVAAVGHLHDPGLGIGGRGARLLWVLLGRCGLAGCGLRRLPGRPFSLPTRLLLLLGAQFTGYGQRPGARALRRRADGPRLAAARPDRH